MSLTLPSAFRNPKDDSTVPQQDTGVPSITTLKLQARLALESLVSQCGRELRNLERFSDDRMLLATADLKSSLDRVDEAADELETAWEDHKARQTWAQELLNGAAEYCSAQALIAATKQDGAQECTDYAQACLLLQNKSDELYVEGLPL